MDNLDLSISIAQEEGTDAVLGFNQKEEKIGQGPLYEDQYSERGSITTPVNKRHTKSGNILNN